MDAEGSERGLEWWVERFGEGLHVGEQEEHVLGGGLLSWRSLVWVEVVGRCWLGG